MDLQPLVDAAVAHQWFMLVALLVGLLVDLAKQGWFTSWLARKLKPAYLPWVAIALGVLGTDMTALAHGTPFVQAFMEGVAAALSAIAGHEVLIESIRKGKEIVPVAPWHQEPAPPASVDPPTLH